MRRVVGAVVAAFICLVLAGCSQNRPEGIVERWLTTINQPTGDPDQFADKTLTNRILPEPREGDELEVIEVGSGKISGDSALVPFRVERNKARGGDKIEGAIELELKEGSWRVVAINTADRTLKVPSRGGERIGRAPYWAWPVAVGIGGVLVLITIGVMTLVNRSVRKAGST